MPPISRLGDNSQVPVDAHGCPGCPHSSMGPAITGSPTVLVDARPALRVDDVGLHAACCGTNLWQALTGSATVMINGKPAHRLGDDDLHCGGLGKMIEGSGTVNVGGAKTVSAAGMGALLKNVLGSLFHGNPMAVPPGVSLDANIREAEAHRPCDPNGVLSVLNPFVGVYCDVNQAAALAWFANRVREGGEWDYKRLGGQYEYFGNFNYGATGRALGLPRDVILRAGGAVQVLTNLRRLAEGKPTTPSEGTPLDLGDSSYGDDPRDQQMITDGIDYYDRHHR